MQSFGRRAFLVLTSATLGGCLDRAAEPPAAADDGVVPPETPPASAPSTPAVVTEATLETRIDPAPLVVHEAPGFSFAYPRNWVERSSGTDDGTVRFEYVTADGRVLGNLRAWGTLNTLYDDLSAAGTETVEQLTAAGHDVLGQRRVTLSDNRPGRIVDYGLASQPVRGSTVVTLAGPFVIRLVVLVHQDAYTTQLGERIDRILTSLTYTA
jgi:hypothetical protein